MFFRKLEALHVKDLQLMECQWTSSTRWWLVLTAKVEDFCWRASNCGCSFHLGFLNLLNINIWPWLSQVCPEASHTVEYNRSLWFPFLWVLCTRVLSSSSSSSSAGFRGTPTPSPPPFGIPVNQVFELVPGMKQTRCLEEGSDMWHPTHHEHTESTTKIRWFGQLKMDGSWEIEEGNANLNWVSVSCGWRCIPYHPCMLSYMYAQKSTKCW